MRRIKGLAVVLAAALAAAACGVSYGAVSVYESLYSYDRYDSGEYADDDDSYSSRSEQDAMNGPGVVMDEDEARTSGPTVKKVTLSEQYHEEYKTYEESMADVFFLYTNVANGGITDQPVTIDIPANLTYTMEKDGAPWPYTAGQRLTERGTYVLKLSGVEDPELPLSRQTEYEAVFRFRIQEKPPAESSGSEIPGTVGVNENGETVLWGDIPEWTSSEALRTGNGASGGSTSSAEAPESADAADAVTADAAQTGDAVQTDDAVQADGTAQTDGTAQADGAGDEADGNEQTDSSDIADETGHLVPAQAERTQVYNPARGVYLVTLESGKDLVSNVPEGYIGPGPVEVTVAEENADEVLLQRDDQPAEYVRGEAITEPGRYRLVMDGCSYVFAIAVQTGDLDLYPAPEGTRFVSASFDGESLSLESDRYVRMEADGAYILSLEGENGERLEVSLVKDTQAPEFEVTLQGGTASIQYLSDDIEQILLEKNGEPVTGFSGYTVSAPGTYRLTVTDGAGNASSVEFTLRYHVNAYGVAAVILVILVIAGAVGFIIHTKKTIKIR